MTPQCHAIFCIMPPLLVVLAVKVLVTLRGVSSYLIWPFKVWLILKFFQDFVYWFSEHNTNYLSISSSRVPSKISLRSVVIVSIRPEIPFILRATLAFHFPCCWSSSTCLYSSIQSMSWHILLTGFLVKDFLRSCSAGKPTLKVLIATSSKFSSISLNISQCLSKYVFRVSPSRIVINSRESKGRETLLQVTKQAPNALMNSFKELKEPSIRLSNHLIATGSKLDENT